MNTGKMKWEMRWEETQAHGGSGSEVGENTGSLGRKKEEQEKRPLDLHYIVRPCPKQTNKNKTDIDDKIAPLCGRV